MDESDMAAGARREALRETIAFLEWSRRRRREAEFFTWAIYWLGLGLWAAGTAVFLWLLMGAGDV